MREARAAYEFSLASFMWKQAAFFAERLMAEAPCDEHAYLLALAYFHNEEHWRARWHLTGSRLPEARYLLAKCCFRLRRWEEAEDALLLEPTAASAAEAVANGAAGLFLLGQIKEKQSQDCHAVECYAKCLDMCPFMWEAYERLSWLILGSPSASRSFSSVALATFTDERMAAALPAGRGAASAARGAVARGEDRGEASGAAPPLPVRRSLLAEDLAPDKDGAGGDGSGEALSLAQLLRKLGLAVHALHAFECGQTLQLLRQLPKRHYETGYVLYLVGVCHFEAANYAKAEEVFEQVWVAEPPRMEGLEIYSTALWHLRKDVVLGFLAQQVLRGNRQRPEVWCVVGNSFSLQKEHDTAIRFFKRAIDIDPSFTYAYTLCGHEFVENEKFHKAIPMFEQALSIDSRHYNAWWGLGNIYHRQEEHENAKQHFEKALKINKNNSVLRCSLGMVLETLNNPLIALEHFDRAAGGEPPSGLAYFCKARVLMGLERYEEALADLKRVRCLAPKEASVHFELGRAYMELRQDWKALQHFTFALDLNQDCKDNNTISAHIERLQGLAQPEPPEPAPAPRGGRAQARRAAPAVTPVVVRHTAGSPGRRAAPGPVSRGTPYGGPGWRPAAPARAVARPGGSLSPGWQGAPAPAAYPPGAGPAVPF